MIQVNDEKPNLVLISIDKDGDEIYFDPENDIQYLRTPIFGETVWFRNRTGKYFVIHRVQVKPPNSALLDAARDRLLEADKRIPLTGDNTFIAIFMLLKRFIHQCDICNVIMSILVDLYPLPKHPSINTKSILSLLPGLTFDNWRVVKKTRMSVYYGGLFIDSEGVIVKYTDSRRVLISAGIDLAEVWTIDENRWCEANFALAEILRIRREEFKIEN